MTDVVPAHGSTTPSAWVARFAPLVPPGRILDVAAGTGRHSRFFQGRSHAVTAVDRNIAELTLDPDGPAADVVQHDLEGGAPWPFPGASFAAVVVTNYLHRPLFPHLLLSVQAGGLLLYETFAVGNEAFGRPRHPDHLLRTGELLEVVRGTLEVIAYEHLTIDGPQPAVVQRIAARRSA
jgi:SAM-dependent methyltransferase